MREYLIRRINGVEFKQVSWSAPEEWKAYIAGKQVGYLRIESHSIEVSYPDENELGCPGTARVYYKEGLKGWNNFKDEEEQQRELTSASIALKAIIKFIDRFDVTIS